MIAQRRRRDRHIQFAPRPLHPVAEQADQPETHRVRQRMHHLGHGHLVELEEVRSGSLSATRSVTWTFLVLIAVWSAFAWALSPAVQAGIIAIDPQRAMLALALGISGLYGGSAVGAAIGAYLIDNHSAAAIPFSGAAVVAGAWLLTLPAARPSQADNGTDAQQQTAFGSARR